MKIPSIITKWAKLIAVGEGATPASNNPGNLKYTSLTASWGAKRGRAATDGGYLSKFDTYDAGFTALVNFLMLGCEDHLLAFHKARTITKFTRIYAGNPPQPYIDRIVQGLGVDPNVDIATFLA